MLSGGRRILLEENQASHANYVIAGYLFSKGRKRRLLLIILEFLMQPIETTQLTEIKGIL